VRDALTRSPAAIAVTLVAAALFAVGIGDPIGVGYVASGAALFFAAAGLVVVSGWARQVNLGQYGFLGVGAWVAGALPGVPFLLRVLIGGAAAAALAVPVGLAASRLRGLALGALTLLVGLTLWNLGNVPSVMRLVDGGVFTGVRVDRPAGFTGDQAYALLSVAIAGAALVLVLALRRTRTGQAMAGLSTSRRALVAAGWSPRWLVVTAFVISAGLAGAGGVLLAANYGALSPTDIVPFNSLVLYAFLFVGGAARPAAAVLAAVIIAGSTAAGSSAASTALVGGLALAAGGALLPEGFLERIDRRVRTRRGRHAVAEPVALEGTT
jgi:ABC-type branched-subunit amino acid transport system permease subunit